MRKQEIEAILAEHPQAVFSGPYAGYYTNLVWDPTRRLFQGDFENRQGYAARRAVRSATLRLLVRTTAEYVALREGEEQRIAEARAREERKRRAREREVAVLAEHETEIRSTIGRVLGVRPEDIATDTRRGTVSINVSATVALMMLDRVSR